MSSLNDFDPKEVIETVVKNVSQCSVTLSKNSKGYGWEIKAYADNMNDAIDRAIAADMRLKTQFRGGESE